MTAAVPSSTHDHTETAAEPAATSAAVSADSGLDKKAADAWVAVKDTTSVGILRTYIARFKGTVFADMAAARLAEIEAATPVEQAPVEDSTAPPADAEGEVAVAPDPPATAADNPPSDSSGPVPVLPALQDLHHAGVLESGHRLGLAG